MSLTEDFKMPARMLLPIFSNDLKDALHTSSIDLTVRGPALSGVCRIAARFRHSKSFSAVQEKFGHSSITAQNLPLQKWTAK